MFTPRKDKSVWSKLNKTYIERLLAENLMHESGLRKIEIAKQNGSWQSLDAVENLEIPTDLQKAFDVNKTAFNNYQNFSPSYRKSYLYWLNQAKREETRNIRITEIIRLCEGNIKSVSFTHLDVYKIQPPVIDFVVGRNALQMACQSSFAG